jgi:hypothetical protein
LPNRSVPERETGTICFETRTTNAPESVPERNAALRPTPCDANRSTKNSATSNTVGSSLAGEPRIADLTVSSEPVGQVSGTLALMGNESSGEVEVTASRLAITGTGKIALNSCM